MKCWDILRRAALGLFFCLGLFFFLRRWEEVVALLYSIESNPDHTEIDKLRIDFPWTLN